MTTTSPKKLNSTNNQNHSIDNSPSKNVKSEEMVGPPVIMNTPDYLRKVGFPYAKNHCISLKANQDDDDDDDDEDYDEEVEEGTEYDPDNPSDHFKLKKTKQKGDIFKQANIVWGKMSGHPAWPSRFSTVDELTPTRRIKHAALCAKDYDSAQPNDYVLLFFFGARQYGCVHKSETEPYLEKYKNYYSKCKASTFIKALEEAEGDAVREAFPNGTSRCMVCGGSNNPHLIILCDRCNGETHLNCAKPPLSSVPEGEWYCSLCKIEAPLSFEALTTNNKKATKSNPKNAGRKKKVDAADNVNVNTSSKSEDADSNEEEEEEENVEKVKRAKRSNEVVDYTATKIIRSDDPKMNRNNSLNTNESVRSFWTLEEDKVLMSGRNKDEKGMIFVVDTDCV